MERDPTSRFSERVEAYLVSRPSYPKAAFDFIFDTLGLSKDATAVDVGSGTGLSTIPLLERCPVVYGVEPNPAMRGAAVRFLEGRQAFVPVEGRAEDTTLPSACADLVVAGQAFHWFDVLGFRDECQRVLKPGGGVALLWNERLVHATPFLEGYEALLHKYGTDYAEVDHRKVSDKAIAGFFSPGGYEHRAFENVQVFDYAGLESRLSSSSYVPNPTEPAAQPMLQALRELFEAHQAHGRVEFLYTTNVYAGRMA